MHSLPCSTPGTRAQYGLCLYCHSTSSGPTHSPSNGHLPSCSYCLPTTLQPATAWLSRPPAVSTRIRPFLGPHHHNTSPAGPCPWASTLGSTGRSGSSNPQPPCLAWHDRPVAPCPCCPVSSTTGHLPAPRHAGTPHPQLPYSSIHLGAHTYLHRVRSPSSAIPATSNARTLPLPPPGCLVSSCTILGTSVRPPLRHPPKHPRQVVNPRSSW